MLLLSIKVWGDAIRSLIEAINQVSNTNQAIVNGIRNLFVAVDTSWFDRFGPSIITGALTLILIIIALCSLCNAAEANRIANQANKDAKEAVQDANRIAQEANDETRKQTSAQIVLQQKELEITESKIIEEKIWRQKDFFMTYTLPRYHKISEIFDEVRIGKHISEEPRTDIIAQQMDGGNRLDSIAITPVDTEDIFREVGHSVLVQYYFQNTYALIIECVKRLHKLSNDFANKYHNKTMNNEEKIYRISKLNCVYYATVHLILMVLHDLCMLNEREHNERYITEKDMEIHGTQLEDIINALKEKQFLSAQIVEQYSNLKKNYSVIKHDRVNQE